MGIVRLNCIGSSSLVLIVLFEKQCGMWIAPLSVEFRILIPFEYPSSNIAPYNLKLRLVVHWLSEQAIFLLFSDREVQVHGCL